MPVGKNSITRATNSKEAVIVEELKKFEKCYGEVDFENIINNNKKIEQNNDLEELTKNYGIIEPVILRQTNEKTFELIYGFDNYGIAKKLKIKKIPAVVIVCNDEEAKQIFKVLNIKKVETIKTEKENAINKQFKTNYDKKELPIYLL
jgi:hypothetical protein